MRQSLPPSPQITIPLNFETLLNFWWGLAWDGVSSHDSDLPCQMSAVASDLRDEKGQWRVSHVIVDVTQNEAMRSSAIRQVVAPALLKRSKLWELVSDSGIPVSMHWLIQGFPHPSARSLESSEIDEFPFPELLRSGSLSLCDQRALTGNSMHCAVAGSWLGHVIACLRFRS